MLRAHQLRQKAPTALETSKAHARGVLVLRAPILNIAGIGHGFSTRAGGLTTVYGNPDSTIGELNLGFTTADTRSNVLENRARLLDQVFGASGPVHAEKQQLVTLRQVHSSILHRVGPAHVGAAALLVGDGVMTNEPGIAIGIQTADCVPILVADRRRGAVAAFHAGWRGTLRRIVENGIGRMRLEFGSEPEDLVAAIGPAIGQCCYSVGEEVMHEFRSQFCYADELFRKVNPLSHQVPDASEAGMKLHLDLQEANRRQLREAGLQEGAIETVGQCTSCRTDLFFSYRAENGLTGRMLAVIARD